MGKRYSHMVEPPSWSTTDVFAEDYFSSAKPADGSWSYFSARLSHPALRRVEAITVPRDAFRLGQGSAEAFSSSCNLWVGPPGTTAGFHYDPTDNFFVQVCGRKRFLLVTL